MPLVADSFPRQYARTQRLTLGESRNVTVSADGQRILFARSRAGDDAVNCLWSIDLDSGDERLIADPITLLAEIAADDADLPPEERARRERLREGAGGITGYDTDSTGDVAVFSLAGQLFRCDVAAGTTTHIPVAGSVFDPHPSPVGDLIAYVSGDELWVTDPAGNARPLATETRGVATGDASTATVSWGSADFIAAEEMGRYRGYWWSPDGTALAVCRVDVADVPVWNISDPAAPVTPPHLIRYPAAGESNPDVTLWLCQPGRPERVEVTWDRAAFTYLAKVAWTPQGLSLVVQSRDQRSVSVLVADPTTGATSTVWEDTDEHWVELVPGTGALVAESTPVMCADRDGARRLLVGDDLVSPADIQVRSVVAATAHSIVVIGNPLDDATVQHIYRWTPDGFSALTDGLGVNAAAVGGETIVLRSAVIDEPGAQWRLPNGDTITSHAERPLVRPLVTVRTHTADAPTTAVLLPHDHDGSPLPVLMDPYGGPHAQRVLRSHNAFCASQWFADQGFAVVIADGRGTPGRGSSYERSVHHDLAAGVLDDQVAALHAAAQRHPEIDLDRVAIRGWSFGGYLSALAVMQRPDVFHAGIAGAPVTEWRLYDTDYTERYLGNPNEHPEVYDANSLLPLAPQLERPLLLIHGLADDNVVAAHTLQLSSALLAAGKPHEVLPLVGVSHMTPQEVVAENLLLHQLDFLRRSLP